RCSASECCSPRATERAHDFHEIGARSQYSPAADTTADSITEPAVSHAGAEQGAAVSQGPSWSPSLRSRSTHVEGDSGREGQADDDRSGDEQRVHQRSVAATTAVRAGKSPPLWSAPRQRALALGLRVRG